MQLADTVCSMYCYIIIIIITAVNCYNNPLVKSEDKMYLLTFYL